MGRGLVNRGAFGQQPGHSCPEVLVSREQRTAARILTKVGQKGFLPAAQVEAVGFPPERIVYDPALYLTTEEAYFNILVGLEESVREVMIVGHNPEVSNLLHFFLPDFTSFMQTGACACLEFEAETWQSIFTAPHQLKFYSKA